VGAGQKLLIAWYNHDEICPEPVGIWGHYNYRFLAGNTSYFYDYLVGGLEHFLFFHNIWDNPSH
jgi:hypothetical protein